jgi:hypothetical protein
MALAQFKFKKADASTQLATFNEQPSWEDLVTEITHLFVIPPDNIIVSYIDKHKETITLHNEASSCILYLHLICSFSVMEREWVISGAICVTDRGYYYLDPGMQGESACCLETVLTCQLALLWGAPASRKTTQLLWLWKKLTEMGYQAL